MADFHEDTALLIDRMCELVERKSFTLNKKEAAETILKTYDLFGLPRPKKVVWYRDPFNEKYLESAWSARSARSALDDGFWYFVFEYEYCKNPDVDKLPNENDKKYLEYSQLIMQAMEFGAGYRIEWEDTLYIVPTPLVLIDGTNRFHSEVAPAIRWKGSKEFYYLNGENFDKGLWQKIVDKTITVDEVMKIQDSDKREIAFSMLGSQEMLKGLNAKLIHTGIKGNKLYECKNFRNTGDTEYALVMKDASTPREFIKFVLPELGKTGNADVATAGMYQDEQGNSLPLEDYLLLTAENEA